MNPNQPPDEKDFKDVMRTRQAFFKVRAGLAVARAKAEPARSPQETHNLKKHGEQHRMLAHSHEAVDGEDM